MPNIKTKRKRTQKFITIIIKNIEIERLQNERIRATPFNTQSSRSFLFLDINIYKNIELYSNIFIIDMAGIENQGLMLSNILQKLYNAEHGYILSSYAIKELIDDNIEIPVDNYKIWNGTKLWRQDANNFKLDIDELNKIIIIPDDIRDKYQRNYTIKIRKKIIEQLKSVDRDGDAF